MSHKIMIVAGEPSGDLHASGLVRELKNQRPDLDIFGIGGDKMQQQGVELLYHIREMSVIGFIDVIKRFPFFKKVFRHLVAEMKQKRPSVVILIDYPGMNLKLAKEAKELGIPVFYYIAPQVWAWGANRIPKMAQLVDKMAVIIPFEEKLFHDAGLETHFVGHPLLEVLTTNKSRDEFITTNDLLADRKILGLLPGSRHLEVKRLLPEMIKAASELLRKHNDLQVVIGRSSSVENGLYDQIADGNKLIKILDDETYQIMKYSDLLIVASGTATLESALFETPLLLVYKVDPISFQIGKRLVKIPNIGLVNVIAEKKIVPEFIQNQHKSENLVPHAEKLIYDNAARDEMIFELKKIRQKLGKSGASEKTAQLVLEMI